jgi:hypothetical protein
MRQILGMALALALLAGCKEPEPEAPTYGVASEAPVASGAKRRFSFETLDGRLVSNKTYADRMTVIVLAATYDTASQAQARFLNTVYTRHTPRVNALLLVLEPDHHAPLVQAFAQSLDLAYDVALSGEATIAGKGPFPGLHHVPSVVLLDREGREVWRNLGVANHDALSAAIRKHDPRAR